MLTGILPGSFDPVTTGHMDLILRAGKTLDHLIIAVLDNNQKEPLFPIEERIEMLNRCISREEELKSRITIEAFHGMLADYAKEKNCRIIVRGLRNSVDFEYEKQIATVNKSLNPDLDTFFLCTSPEYSHISSTVVKEVLKYGKSLKGYVPEEIQHMVEKK